MTAKIKGKNPSVLLSIIVPMHNAINKLGLCIDSLAMFEKNEALLGFTGDQQLEILIIDDHSSDGTFEVLKQECETRLNWRLLRTLENTGSPSTPRNMGIAEAQGKYLFFLDGDDEIDVVGIVAALKLAESHGYEVVRGPVQVYYRGDRRILIDRIQPPENCSAEEMIVEIARGQSLNCSAIWSKELLTRNNLKFDPETRMGEDIVFTAAAMTKAESIGYVDAPLFHYVRQPGGGNSSMHYYSGRELRELVASWQSVEDAFAARDLSYLELHGDRTINYALRLVIRHYDRENISDDDLKIFTSFFRRNDKQLNAIKFVDPHVKSLVATLSSGKPEAFWNAVKPRLLIAGHDLKFIKPAIPLLREKYQIRIDEWPSEVVHDVRQSTQLLEWADFIWVEWLTAASVWYGDRVKPTQKMVVRMHRYELGRSYGDQIRRSAISAFVAIAPHCLEDMIERFDFDRGKVRFIPNFYFVDSYASADIDNHDRVFRLAMIGAVPQRKGYLKALELLAGLRKVDQRYTLSVLGKEFKDFPWVAGDPLEQAYFGACDEYIRQNELEGVVDQRGWSDTYSAAQEFGFVLSMSEHEGSHVGPGEAFCAGNQGVFLPWRGVEYVYPESSVFPDVDAMSKHILEMRDLSTFNEVSKAGKKYMKDNYDISHFVERVDNLFKELS